MTKAEKALLQPNVLKAVEIALNHSGDCRCQNCTTAYFAVADAVWPYRVAGTEKPKKQDSDPVDDALRDLEDLTDQIDRSARHLKLLLKGPSV